ncbi:MAG TPA: histidine--tRNA ligase [Clostridia bacterium]|nr:histidine--tRNA ligase [Clostridia bacterium]
MIIRAPRGTKDVLPNESYKWHYLEKIIREITDLFGYKEVRTPVFEHTELFVRGVGDTTDIVQKEMYTFLDKGDRSITLKPEGTAGAVRAYIEHSLYGVAQPIKMYYLTPVFRYENPQAGRLREHHQFGVEVFGAKEPSIDAEIIMLAMTLFNRLGLKGLELNINSIGCHCCRPKYHDALREYLKDHLDELCNTCNDRYEKNPLRILDCKTKECGIIVKNAPIILDFICHECSTHFEGLKRFLEMASIEYKINPMIVRGLDYYSKTVFEVISTQIGAQGTVCGGGRYDSLVGECGGPETPGAGFGLGLERLILALESQNISIPQQLARDVFFVSIGEKARYRAFDLMQAMRSKGISSEMDHVGRSVKAQFKYADKANVTWVCIMGDQELENNQVKIRSMEDGKEELIPQKDIIHYIQEKKGDER